MSKISLLALVENVNQRNRETVCSPDVRHGWNALLEEMLHRAGCFQGFTYFCQGQVPEGQLPGVEWSQGDHNPTFPDESRRCYVIDKKLRPKAKATK